MPLRVQRRAAGRRDRVKPHGDCFIRWAADRMQTAGMPPGFVCPAMTWRPISAGIQETNPTLSQKAGAALRPGLNPGSLVA